MLTTMAITLALLGAADKVKIKDVTVGKGRSAVAGDTVTVEYTGKLTNGKQFDSSVGREPFKFTLGAGEVIKGWDQGIAGMKPGGKRILTIPPSLGYGAQGSGNVIPPNSTLIFEVTLLTIDAITVQVQKKGTGPAARRGDTVQVHYTGLFPNGTKFDSSRDRNQPFTVTIGETRLIPGFTQGLIGMKAGEKRRVTIPPALGYGSVARGPIPANSTLIFELEMLRITPR
jgi:FKBP-type peptidyl-prolyl cis-trans isomerase